MTIQFVRGITALYGEKGRIDFQPLFAKKGLRFSRRSSHTRKQWNSSLRERKSSTWRVEKTDPHSADYPLPRPSLFFHFTPFFIGHMPKACFLNGLLNTFFLICLKSLPSILTFAIKQLFLTFLTSGKIEIMEDDTPTLQTGELN